MRPLRLFKKDLKFLNGFLPINKPKGVCCNKLMYLLRADINFVLGKQEVNHGPFEVFYAKGLEPFADGIITFSFGLSNRWRRNFIHAEYRHKAVVELGVERDCSDINGQVLSHARIDHLSKEDIEEALQDFTGTFTQARCKYYHQKPNDLALSERLATSEGIYDLIELEEMDWRSTEEKPPQKYPIAQNKRDVNCQEMRLIEYNQPIATIDIVSKGGLSVRQFVIDLGEKLRTKASLIGLTRYMEGPIHLNDPRVVQLYETQLEHYHHKMSMMQKTYEKYVEQFNHLFEKENYRRLV